MPSRSLAFASFAVCRGRRHRAGPGATGRRRRGPPHRGSHRPPRRTRMAPCSGSRLTPRAGCWLRGPLGTRRPTVCAPIRFTMVGSCGGRPATRPSAAASWSSAARPGACVGRRRPGRGPGSGLPGLAGLDRDAPVWTVRGPVRPPHVCDSPTRVARASAGGVHEHIGHGHRALVPRSSRRHAGIGLGDDQRAILGAHGRRRRPASRRSSPAPRGVRTRRCGAAARVCDSVEMAFVHHTVNSNCYSRSPGPTTWSEGSTRTTCEGRHSATSRTTSSSTASGGSTRAATAAWISR